MSPPGILFLFISATLLDRWKRLTGHLSIDDVPCPAGVPGADEVSALAWQGQESEARSAVAETIRDSVEVGARLGVLTAQYAVTVLELGLGRYEEALAAALIVYTDDPPCLGTQILPDLVYRYDGAARLVEQASRRRGGRRRGRRTVRCRLERGQLLGQRLGRVGVGIGDEEQEPWARGRPMGVLG